MFDLKDLIVYEDEALMVINKPKGLIVHPTKYELHNTLVNLIKDKVELLSFFHPDRCGICQRLDRNTNGLMVVAKNQDVLNNLIDQIQSKALIRKYYSLVDGIINDDELIIKAPIHRSKNGKMKFSVSNSLKAKDATTIVKVIERFKNYSLIECQLLTGRTHQIRVHMNYIHHSVYNDPVYSNQCDDENYGQFLTSKYLRFYHPITNDVKEFSIKLDETFTNKLKELRNEKQ
ncbi:ribosomal large subunit pseudouridylate synthase D [Candidatus Malacoplasma girerdii]|uniref:Pseudouridine synthase n=1 Tax=Candidatus Malacoplasma girerdii TaxID=1318617 RepID=A0A097SST0_9BACT|nr:ribosomal large subunit pseudouridylate synthase D [Candidatus Malacoplasma girerdii]ASJ89181.1 MAG: ribosomal large subunit pseudouridine synthase D [Candidatus Malacoplasma girerdii]